ncbi:MAG TPA: hypothetical protein PKH99_04005, partial [Vicinamibacterales bacterium]|nr:hypothetical protein [Vicinamibacterales bacterium]
MCKSAHGLLVAAAAVLAGSLLGAGEARAQAGPIGSSDRLYSGATRWPDVAYDTRNRVYLAVWGPGVIRGIFVSEDGAAIGASFRISDPAVYSQTPRVAYNPDDGSFLVAWHSSDGVASYASGTRVRGRVVSYTSGVSAAAPQAYSNETYTTRWEVGPAIAYASGSRRFLVAYNIFSATGAEIGARVVDAAGNAVGPEIAVTSSPSEYDREPAVGYFPATNRFLLAWAVSGTNADYVRARLHSASDGSAVSGTVTLAETTVTYVPEVALNTNTGEMFVEWIQQDSATGGWRPFGRFVSSAGAVLTSARRLSSTVGSYDANSVAYNGLTGTFFLVTHLQGTPQDMGFEITGAGSPVAAATTVTSVTAENLTGSYNPRLAASSQRARWLIVTAASFASLWGQLIGEGGAPGGGDDGGGSGTGGTANPQLTISPAPTGGTVSGGGLNCGTGGTTCQLTFTSPSSVTLSATPSPGYAFSGWGGACSGTGTTTTVTVNAALTCTATFTVPWSGSGTEPSGCPAAPSVTFAASPGPIGSSINQFTGAVQYQDLAYSSCQQMYLAVWGSGGVIKGRFVGESGAGAGDAFDISTGGWAQRPRVVYNPNLGRFLVAWHSGASESRTEVRAAAVTYPPGPAAAGTVLSAPTYSTVSSARPAIAYSTGSGRYLVAWPRSSSSGTEINARLLDASGAPVGDEFAVTSTSSEAEREPAAAYFPAVNRFIVTWSATGGASDFVRGRLYDAGTAAPYGTTLSLAEGSFVHVPDAALNSVTGNVLVAWMQLDTATGGPRPFGRFVSGAGTLLSAAPSRLSAVAGAFLANALAFNPLSQSFLLVTHGSDTLQDVGFEIDGAGAPIGAAAAVTSVTAPDLSGSFYPRIAASTRQPRWLIGTAASSTSLWTQLVGGRQPAAAVTYQLNVTKPTGGSVSGGGIACGPAGTACSATFSSATTVTLTAAPEGGYTFTSWGGGCSGAGTTTTVLVDGVKTCTASFAAASTYVMTIGPRPSGGTVTGAGLNCGAGGSACSVTMPAPMTLGLQATPAAGYTFTGWTGDCSGTNASLAINLTGARTCGATFAPMAATYQLSVSQPAGGTVSGGGISCGSGGAACSVTFPAATTVTLTAAPDANYTFTGWGGACSGASPNTTVTVDGIKSCTAVFAPTVAFGLAITPVPAGGTVTGGGLTCGAGGSACSVTFPAATTVTLTAAPDATHTFTGWGGRCTGTGLTTTVTVDGATTCTATFGGLAAGPPYTMTIGPVPTGGTVTGAGLNCGAGGSACSVTMPASMTLGLQATPAAGYTFTGWTGNCAGSTASLFLALTGARTCSATFSPAGTTPGITHQLAITPVPAGGTVTGGGLT